MYSFSSDPIVRPALAFFVPDSTLAVAQGHSTVSLQPATSYRLASRLRSSQCRAVILSHL